MKTAKETWERYRDKVVHPERRGKNEVENLRRTFYSGMMAGVGLLEQIDLSKDGGVQQVLALLQEMNEFYDGVTDEGRTEGTTASGGKEF